MGRGHNALNALPAWASQGIMIGASMVRHTHKGGVMPEGTPQTRDLHNFAAVDQTTDVSALVASLDLAHSLPFYQDLNRQSYARLHIQPGHHLLDVGCGAGTDVQALARLVGPTGQVVGLDVSVAMIQEARRRAATSGLTVAFRVGDVRQLADADAVFDGCRWVVSQIVLRWS